MDFIEIEVFCEENFREIFMAELSEIDFNTFMETDSGFLAYIETDKFISGDLQNTFEKYAGIKVSYKVSHVKEKNWNEEWEKNYDPIIVEDKCLIHATFHNLTKTYPYEVLINPRMSFGTGHHETTISCAVTSWMWSIPANRYWILVVVRGYLLFWLLNGVQLQYLLLTTMTGHMKMLWIM